MEEDTQILTTLLKLTFPSCMNGEAIEQILQEIPKQLPVVVPVRMMQEVVVAGELPPLDECHPGKQPSKGCKGQLQMVCCIHLEC
jgi:hypothetical protein